MKKIAYIEVEKESALELLNLIENPSRAFTCHGYANGVSDILRILKLDIDKIKAIAKNG